MLIYLGFSALGIFVLALAALCGGWATPTVAAHTVLVLAILPLIFGAMTHFVPVLTRSGNPPAALIGVPVVLQLAGLLAMVFVTGAGGLGVLHGAVTLVVVTTLGFAFWVWQRARHALGAPHPGWRWYFMALICLAAGVALAAVMYLQPAHYQPLRAVHVRFNLFGFVGLTALGTLHVLLPTVFGRPEARTALRLRQDLPWAAAGVALLALGAGADGDSALTSSVAGAVVLASCAVRLGFAWWRAYGLRALFADGAAASLCVALWGFVMSLAVLAVQACGALVTVSLPGVFVVAFLMPLVGGALAQLLPVWRHPGRRTPARDACRGLFIRHGTWRAALHWAAGLALAGDAPELALPLAGLAGLAVLGAACLALRGERAC